MLTTTYAHDALRRMVCSTTANSIAITYGHDANGQLPEQVLDPNGLALKTTYGFDVNGNLVTKTNANGHVSRYAYDAENRLVASVDGEGGVMLTTYDPNGRIAKTLAHAQAIVLDGLPLAASLADIAARIRPNASDQTSHRVYDRDGRLTATIDGIGAVVTYRYDGNGNTIERRAHAQAIDLANWRPGTLPAVQPDDIHDQRLRTLYDAANRAIASIDGIGGLTVQRYDANGNVTRWRFDAAGQLQAELHADGGIVTHQYDAFGNAVGTIDARGYRQSMRYDALDRRIETRVDGLLVHSASYDEAGRIIASGNGAGAGAGAGEMLRYRYDLRGNVVDILQPMGQRTRYAYDDHNRQIAVTDANGRTATCAYDDFGLLLSHTDIGGAVYTYRYDAARQLVEQANSRGQHILYGYDAAGRQIRIDDRATGKLTTYRLDARGNHLTERTLQGGEMLQDDCSFLSASLGLACLAWRSW